MFFLLFILTFLVSSIVAVSVVKKLQVQTPPPIDCLLTESSTQNISCQNNKLYFAYDISQNNNSSGKSCIDSAISLNKNGFSNWSIKNKQVIGYKDCSDCILGDFSIIDCDGNKQKKRYQITQFPNNSTVSCSVAASTLDNSFSNWTQITDNNNVNYIIGEKDCNNCILTNPKIIDCSGNKQKKIYQVSSRPQNSNKTCIDTIKELEPSFTNWSEITGDNGVNYIIGEKDCGDCLLDTPSIIDCDGNKQKKKMRVIQQPYNNSKSCVDIAQISDNTYSWSQSNDGQYVIGEKDCNDCKLGDYYESGCITSNKKITILRTISSQNNFSNTNLLQRNTSKQIYQIGIIDISSNIDSINGNVNFNVILNGQANLSLNGYNQIFIDNTESTIRNNFINLIDGGIVIRDITNREVLRIQIGSNHNNYNFNFNSNYSLSLSKSQFPLTIYELSDSYKDITSISCSINMSFSSNYILDSVVIRTANISQFENNSSQTCDKVAGNIYPDYTNWTVSGNTVVGIKSCTNCELEEAGDIECDGVLYKKKLKIKTIPSSNGTDCITVAKGKYPDYSNWTPISDNNNNYLIGEISCNDCLLDTSYTDSSCNKTFTRTVNILKDALRSSNTCEVVASKTYNTNIFKSWKRNQNTVISGEVPCKDCDLSGISISECINNKLTMSYNISSRENFGKTCDVIAAQKSPDFSNWNVDVVNNVVSGQKDCNFCVLDETNITDIPCTKSDVSLSLVLVKNNSYSFSTDNIFQPSSIDVGIIQMPSNFTGNVITNIYYNYSSQFSAYTYGFNTLNAGIKILDSNNNILISGISKITPKVLGGITFASYLSVSGYFNTSALTSSSFPLKVNLFLNDTNISYVYNNSVQINLSYKYNFITRSQLTRTIGISKYPLNTNLSCADIANQKYKDTSFNYWTDNGTSVKSIIPCDDCVIDDNYTSYTNCSNNTSTLTYKILTPPFNGLSCVDVAKNKFPNLTNIIQTNDILGNPIIKADISCGDCILSSNYTDSSSCLLTTDNYSTQVLSFNYSNNSTTSFSSNSTQKTVGILNIPSNFSQIIGGTTLNINFSGNGNSNYYLATSTITSNLIITDISNVVLYTFSVPINISGSTINFNNNYQITIPLYYDQFPLNFSQSMNISNASAVITESYSLSLTGSFTKLVSNNIEIKRTIPISKKEFLSSNTCDKVASNTFNDFSNWTVDDQNNVVYGYKPCYDCSLSFDSSSNTDILTQISYNILNYPVNQGKSCTNLDIIKNSNFSGWKISRNIPYDKLTGYGINFNNFTNTKLYGLRNYNNYAVFKVVSSASDNASNVNKYIVLYGNYPTITGIEFNSNFVVKSPSGTWVGLSSVVTRDYIIQANGLVILTQSIYSTDNGNLLLQVSFNPTGNQSIWSLMYYIYYKPTNATRSNYSSLVPVFNNNFY